MAPWTNPDRQPFHAEARVHAQRDPGGSPEPGHRLLEQGARENVDLALQERVDPGRAPDEAGHDPVEIGGVRPPVARVPDERDLLSALEAFDEEGPLPIGLPVFGLSIVSRRALERSSPASAWRGATKRG
jgi:hypothetical protein